ncbi:uncharacterized protein LOC143024785 [Oratosquilla oratoria]|uniref:uncharacterized protein LOC143024785 n=1 Tax=Oratosquilla oratoria TaxID=337810 RepID=UPI003F773007
MMTIRDRTATALVAVVAVVAVMMGRAEAMKCYTCNNCIKYELSQSQTCKAEDEVCMKLDMESGQVQRMCGTEEMCHNSEKLRTQYLGVSCCSEDNCNAAASLTPATHAIILPFLLFLLLPFLVLFLLTPYDAAALVTC